MWIIFVLTIDNKVKVYDGYTEVTSSYYAQTSTQILESENDFTRYEKQRELERLEDASADTERLLESLEAQLNK